MKKPREEEDREEDREEGPEYAENSGSFTVAQRPTLWGRSQP